MLPDHAALVRLESESGAVRRNAYAYPNHTIGPEVPDRWLTEWERVFESGSPGELLAALTWLGGFHVKEGERERGLSLESVEAVQLVERARASPRVRKRLDELEATADGWILDAVKLCRKPDRD